MKTQLTKEQSDKLLELGVPKPMGTNPSVIFVDEEIPVDTIECEFTLGYLLEILPKEIYILNTPYHLNMVETPKYSECFYACHNVRYIIEGFNKADELIDALYELLIWCITESYIKFE